MESENGRIIGPEYEDVNRQYISGGRKTEYLEETAILQRMKEASNTCVVACTSRTSVKVRLIRVISLLWA